MHTIGQHKRLLLARKEGDPTKWGAGSDFGGVGSGLFRHKLSPVFIQQSTVKPLVLIRELAGGYGKNGTKMN